MNILIVDDSAVCAKLATQAVIKFGTPVVATGLSEALTAVHDKHWDLVILDIHLGDDNGFLVFEEMQKHANLKNIPVIFVSGDGEISQKSMAFSLGADDYIVKPFNFLELQMRVNRTLKRLNHQQEYIEVGHFRLSTHQMYFEILGDKSARKIDLSPKEYQLLKFLMENPNQIFTRQQLLDKLWGNEVHITDRTVDSHVYSLRKKMGTQSHFLVSARSWGYQLVLQGTVSQKPKKMA